FSFWCWAGLPQRLPVISGGTRGTTSAGRKSMRKALIAVGMTVALGVQAPLAQVAGGDAFAAANDLCSTAIVEGPLTAAGDTLRAAGWSVEYATNVGPSAQTLRAASRSGDQRGFY